MKIKLTILFTLLMTLTQAYEPKAPKDLILEENHILQVDLNRAVETLLVFPHQIEHLSGSGLVNEGEGQVQYQVGAARKTITLKPLVSRFSVLMQVMVGGKVYVIQFKGSDLPASVVRFRDKDTVGLEVSSKLELSDVEDLVRLPSKPRMMELIRLAKEEAFLKKQLPELYNGSESHTLNANVAVGSYHYVLERAVKFGKEDTLVFVGRVEFPADIQASKGSRQHNIQLEINGKAYYAFNHFELGRDLKRTKQPLRFVGVLIGNGQGKPGHIDLFNDFSLKVTEDLPIQRPSKGSKIGENLNKWVGHGVKVLAVGAVVVLAFAS
ncbi:MAG: hypothetical protein AAF065_13920 [Verrucomicrobiota bacterium]